MARLENNQNVSVIFQTKGLDNKPYKYQKTAKVVSHKKAGWLVLMFPNGTHSRYRVHFKKDGSLSNYENAKIQVQIDPKSP